MILNDIRERLAAEPFEPFQIRSSSGQVYPITSPFLVALMKTKVFIAAPNSDRWAELSYLHIAALEGVSNGHGGRSRRRGRRH
jgi:hypothetical protein